MPHIYLDGVPRSTTPGRTLWLLTLCYLLSACTQSPVPQETAAAHTLDAVEVEVMTLEQRPWHPRIETYGHLVAPEKVTIGVEMAGTVASVQLREGQSVAAGDTLVQLDARRQGLRVKRAEADVASAAADLARSRNTHQRLRQLIGRQVIAEETYQLAEATYRTSAAKLAQARAAANLARLELDELTLISPVDGIVASEFVEPGQRVRPGDTLGLIQATDTLQVITYVREREVNLLRPGDGASVRSPGAPDRSYSAQIESIGQMADPHTGNFPIKLRLDNSEGLLREGMSTRVELYSQHPGQRLLIPLTAVTDRDRQRVVYVARDNRAVRVVPTLGIAREGWVPVVSGLAAGDHLIVSGLPLLARHNRIRVIQSEAPSEALTLK